MPPATVAVPKHNEDLVSKPDGKRLGVWDQYLQFNGWFWFKECTFDTIRMY